MTANELTAREVFKNDREQLSDVLINNSILGHDGPVSSDEAARLLRAAAIVERIAANDGTLEVKGALAQALKRPILMPADIFPLTRTVALRQAAPKPPSEAESVRQREMLLNEGDRLLSTYKMLTRLSTDHFALRTSIKVQQETDIKSNAQASLPPMIPADRPNTDTDTDNVNEVEGSTQQLVLRPEAIASMGEHERAVLSERGLDLTRVGLKTAVDRLLVEL